MTFFSRSLTAQLAGVLALALLIAQSVNFGLLLQSRERVRELQYDGLISRFVSFNEREPLVRRFRDRDGRPPRWARGISVRDKAEAQKFDVSVTATRRLISALTEAEIENAEKALAAIRTTPFEGRASRKILVLSAPTEDGRWVNFMQPLPPEPSVRIEALIVQTVVLYFVLMSGVILLTRRLSRPLSNLTVAAQGLMTDEDAVVLTPEGPDDIRSLTSAFEDMRNRVRHLFDEKDIMLGAIGHDLRTPLTSLRIRAESVTDEKQRMAMIASIDEMTLMLDDILTLARRGKPNGETEELVIGTLIQDVLSTFPDKQDQFSIAGQQDATLIGYPVLLRRALRNLIENGLRYGTNITVRVHENHEVARIAVEDDGPGVSESDLGQLKKAFVRSDPSRNKSTGGTGLGLALVDRIAKSHDGDLILENRAEGGFRAVLVLPKALRA